MDRQAAEALLKLAISLDQPIGDMYVQVAAFSDPEKKSKYKKAVDDLMGYIAHDIIFPIEKDYPDLRPPK
jgi:hypothetical protein